ncbi:MAG: tyrosine-type recombinase/integrase [Clostridia bacterium]|nr:tyrosine-type recombinase/integrase [Clostridia bacterium]
MGKKYEQAIQEPKKEFRVGPIKEKKDLEKIKQYLMGKASKRDFALFVVGINIGLRCGDLVQLRVSDVYDSDSGEFCKKKTIIEQKTGKAREIVLNNSCTDALELYFKERGSLEADDYLFPSRKKCALSVKTVNKMVRETCKELGIKGRYGSHSLRKTFGYWAYKKNIVTDVGFLYTLQEVFGHASSKTTLRYIDIDQEKKADVYKNLNI